jgi:phosphoglycerate dehydrogenase-like enzyme
VEGLEIVEIPADPAGDPRIGDVEVFVPPMPVGGKGGRALGDLLQRMPSLKLVQLLSAGVDGTVELIPAGVTLCSARGGHDTPVAEWVAGAILTGMKGFLGAIEPQRRSAWSPAPVRQVAGSHILLLGYGSIAREVERRLAPFGAHFLRVARRAKEGVADLSALAALLPQADVVVLLLPLTPQTRGLVDAAFLAQMQRGALLVNAARGPVVQTDALVEALRAEHIRAVLDVTDPEPLPAAHPLWQAPGVLITPHIAGNVPDWQIETYAVVRAQLERFARGEPLQNVVSEGY